MNFTLWSQNPKKFLSPPSLPSGGRVQGNCKNEMKCSYSCQQHNASAELRSDRRKNSKELLAERKTNPDSCESLAVGWNGSRRMKTCAWARIKKKKYSECGRCLQYERTVHCLRLRAQIVVDMRLTFTDGQWIQCRIMSHAAGSKGTAAPWRTKQGANQDRK